MREIIILRPVACQEVWALPLASTVHVLICERIAVVGCSQETTAELYDAIIPTLAWVNHPGAKKCIEVLSKCLSFLPADQAGEITKIGGSSTVSTVRMRKSTCIVATVHCSIFCIGSFAV